jgi:predicted nuclease with TOPRIM domain
MKQLQELEKRIKEIITQNADYAESVSLLVQENNALSERMIFLAQENAELVQKVAALTQDNAALSVKFDEVQTQAIHGLDAVSQRDELSSSINGLLASIDSFKPQTSIK